MSKGYQHAGDVEVRSCTLILTTGDIIDISSLVREVNIYQDLFKHHIEAEILLDDSLGLFSSGFVGQEFIQISFRNAVSDEIDTEYVRHIFQIYELSDRQKVSEFREIYIMNCVSPEKYLTTSNKISRSYGPSTISEMVKKISNEFIYNQASKDFYSQISKIFNYTKNKEGVFDETSGRQQLIIPNMPVDDAVVFLCKEADSKNHIPFYTFYEDANGYHFRNIGNLVQEDVRYKYYHLPTATDSSGLDTNKDVDFSFDDAFKMISYNVSKQSNILSNTHRGMYRSKSIDLDLQRRKTNTVIYDYDVYSNKFNAIENKILGGSVGVPYLSLGTSRFGHDSDKTLFDEGHIAKTIDQTEPITRSYRRTLFNVVLEVTVPGNDQVNVGELIDLTFYVTVDNQISSEEVDKYLSGKYLITKVRHKINGAETGSEYVTVIECTRDGIKED